MLRVPNSLHAVEKTGVFVIVRHLRIDRTDRSMPVCRINETNSTQIYTEVSRNDDREKHELSGFFTGAE